MSSSQVEERLKYNFQFDELGLEPSEFSKYLTSKLDNLVHGHPEKIKNLTKGSITNVGKEVRVRQIGGKKDSRMDMRFKATQLYIDEGYLEDYNDTFWKHNNRSGGIITDKWAKEYIKNEETLFDTNLLKSRFRLVDESAVQYCNAIDEVTAALIRDLSDGKQLDETEVKEVYELCGRIVRGRTAVNWAIEVNLFDQRSDEEKKNRILIVISFSALMVVACMLLREVEGHSHTERRSKVFKCCFKFLGLQFCFEI